jgi:hypothetical protein
VNGTQKSYIWNVLWATDILINVALGGKRRTISARLGEKKLLGTLNWFEQWLDQRLDSIDPGHTIDSYHHWQKLTDRHGTVYSLRNGWDE